MLLKGAEGFTLRLFIKVLNWTHEEVQVLLAQVRKDLKDPSIHAYMNMYVCLLSGISNSPSLSLLLFRSSKAKQLNLGT